jgi:hypothetical protein
VVRQLERFKDLWSVQKLEECKRVLLVESLEQVEIFMKRVWDISSSDEFIDLIWKKVCVIKVGIVSFLSS